MAFMNKTIHLNNNQKNNLFIWIVQKSSDRRALTKDSLSQMVNSLKQGKEPPDKSLLFTFLPSALLDISGVGNKSGKW